jgi:hypothetical protein
MNRGERSSAREAGEPRVGSTSNITISRNFSAYFQQFPLTSAANAEEQSAFSEIRPAKIAAFANKEKQFPLAARSRKPGVTCGNDQLSTKAGSIFL